MPARASAVPPVHRFVVSHIQQINLMCRMVDAIDKHDGFCKTGANAVAIPAFFSNSLALGIARALQFLDKPTVVLDDRLGCPVASRTFDDRVAGLNGHGDTVESMPLGLQAVLYNRSRKKLGMVANQLIQLPQVFINGICLSYGYSCLAVGDHLLDPCAEWQIVVQVCGPALLPA